MNCLSDDNFMFQGLLPCQHRWKRRTPSLPSKLSWRQETLEMRLSLHSEIFFPQGSCKDASFLPACKNFSNLFRKSTCFVAYVHISTSQKTLSERDWNTAFKPISVKTWSADVIKLSWSYKNICRVVFKRLPLISKSIFTWENQYQYTCCFILILHI